MPQIKRYFPVSHSFNRDPEVQKLRKEYADWMGYVWQEMCSIADMNEGVVKGTPTEIGLSLSYISLTKRPSLAAKCITNALGFMQVCGWIVIETDRVLVVNYAKYHRTREPVRLPPNLPSEPSEPSEHKYSKKNTNKSGAKAPFILPDWIDSKVWESFESMRKRNRHPLTDDARNRLIAKLEKLRGAGQDPNACLDNSIINDYRGVFPEPRNNVRQLRSDAKREQTRDIFERELPDD